MTRSPDFDSEFRHRFLELLRWRRDVRRFRSDAVPTPILDEILQAVSFAPSVGNSQPWRFVMAESPPVRQALRDSFRRANADALDGYRGDRAALYAGLKLAGLSDAPIILAVCTDEGTDQGHGLGRQTMPEMLRYSTVTAVHTLWLSARCHGLGVGWVSIIEPEGALAALGVPPSWSLTALLCIGWPAEDHLDPELERAGWQARAMEPPTVIRR